MITNDIAAARTNEGAPAALAGVPGLISRRGFLWSGVGALLGPLLTSCGDEPTGPGSPRLSARPGTPSITPTIGRSALGLGSGRDGLLYVPQSYTPGTPAPLFVALHGAGGSAASWASYEARAEARGMVLLAPDSRGSTWDLVGGTYGPDVAFIDQALRLTFDRVDVDPEHLALGGFSDGASYALSLGVSNGDLFSHLVAYSPGFLFKAEPLRGQPAIYVSHGTQDPVLPVSRTRDLIVPALQADGYAVTFQEFDGGHEVPAAISEAALDWFLGV